MKAISVENISKSYGNTKALSGVSFEVKSGEIFGIIGPDGAGKSTLFKILTTLILPEEGKAHILEFDVVDEYKEVRKSVGYMPGKFSLYQDLSVEENLSFFATIFGTTIQENYHLIKDIYDQLAPFKDRKAGDLSGGMKQKLALCCALIHEPKVLFLDEPTTGVDAVSRTEFWDMLAKLKNNGIAILVSTPYMDEANLCDRIALMQDGRILSIDTPEELIKTYKKPLFAVKSTDNYQLLLYLKKQRFTDSVLAFGECLHFTAREKISSAELKERLREDGIQDVQVKKIKPNIEDVFLALSS
ncbi:ABC transporter ATP-binding protein [Galbibacter sp. BG1]|uniref:ABC transporter ATP-binding protein n=1 Tax=Galbibacter sp. BG1 TaxID=1170699 RepID=UPI0015B9C639|nr:ABC transporter ATP-binding protein [Galbibacter sp. BG1]QLE03045.1 ABC transporter ATP-binding protein [Galbibacter sp. BG1]